LCFVQRLARRCYRRHPASVPPGLALVERAGFAHRHRLSLRPFVDFERTAAPGPEACSKLRREEPGFLSLLLSFAVAPPVRGLCESASASPALLASGLGVSSRVCADHRPMPTAAGCAPSFP